MARVFGITGGIATGKSYVSNILKKQGYTVYDADQIAHTVGNQPEVLAKITEEFGDDANNNGQLNRSYIGKIVFNDSEKLERLNNIIQPPILKKVLQIIREIQSDKTKELCFMEVPLLFEEGYEKYFDGTIVVSADRKTQLHRLIQRDQITEDFAKSKIAKQMSLSEKRQKADFVIDNSEGRNVNRQVVDLLEELKTNL
ncbi:dephospho-CoA kinase [Lactobacillus sp. YT155]|uniref:dephospho-CoA kinase n=1 Tax=Lactobacillus sp. YT155 TaxID=3060955 RepID=UPI00265DE85B|nr:dephospho-CoA kinase [Lactobacillus sp. YT155]MDO1605613.1 dephospho-CoA kinase [Lactobacillus sp. YT155]